MKASSKSIVLTLMIFSSPVFAQEGSWTKALENRTKRGTLQDDFQTVRGDSGKWNDEPRLQPAPPIGTKPKGVSIDDWVELLQEQEFQLTDKDDICLLFCTQQLDDNDRVWVERIERRGNQFIIVVTHAVWQGDYSKNFTYYNVYGVNIGKLEPGQYRAKLMIKPMVFKKFDGSGQAQDNWPNDEGPTDRKPTELSVEFTVITEAK